MSTFFTLEYDGVEKSFEDWGFELESPELVLVNQELDVFSVYVPSANITDDPIFAFEAVVKVRRGRVISAGYSGGSLDFTGKRLLHVLDSQPGRRGVVYQFGGPWYDLQQTPFQQSIKTYTGDPDDLTTVLVSSVTLFLKFGATVGTVAAQNNGEQITEILQHLLDQYADQGMAAPYQIGTVDVAVNLPSYQVQDIKCAEAIAICLRSSPDATVWFDYSTSPPTCNVTSTLTPVSLGYANGTDAKSLRISPRYDLQARSVVLYFKRSNQVDDTVWTETIKQKFGPHGADDDLDPDGGLRTVVQTIDLQGSSISNVTGSLVCEAVAANDASQANRRAWWAKVCPELASYNIRFPTALKIKTTAGGTIGTATIIDDDTGASVSLSSYPNRLIDGTIASWMTISGGAAVVGKRVTIRALMTYDEYDVPATSSSENATNGQFLREPIEKEFSAQITLTNGTTGTYATLESSVEGEAVPDGLAESIYNSLAVLQYEGNDIRVEDQVSGLISMGNALNLTGGRTEWATMDAMIMSVRRRYGTGFSEVQIGPARHLSAGDLTQLFLVNRFRRVFYDPRTVATAKSTGNANAVTLGKHAPIKNTNTGLDNFVASQLVAPAADGNTTQILKDAINQKVVVQVVNSSGVRQNVGSVTLALADANNKHLKIVEVDVCVEGVTGYRMMIVGSDPYTP